MKLVIGNTHNTIYQGIATKNYYPTKQQILKSLEWSYLYNQQYTKRRLIKKTLQSNILLNRGLCSVTEAKWNKESNVLNLFPIIKTFLG
ncbi:unnamed protein product [Nezara viridula]|uniref:Uncharacterized protein n=1 Tax=Nezara viridula TaxID=85310 RepID=A0A9P0E277_NEZVI|nr:unnamed protein product [Nezara viridula]